MRGSRKLGRGVCPASSLMLLAKSRHQRDAFATPENAVARSLDYVGKSPLPKMIENPGDSALL